MKIELNQEQLNILQTALELYARLDIGQFYFIPDLVWNLHTSNDPCFADQFPKIHIDRKSKEGKGAWDMYQIIRHENGHQREPFLISDFLPIKIIKDLENERD